MRAFEWAVGIVLVIALLIVVTSLGARFDDGPLAFIPGGPLESGELILEPVADWSFATSVETIEMQLIADDDRSRTTWILVHEGSAFVPSTLGFPPGKSWRLRAVEDGRALVRVEGKRYPVTLVRVDDPDIQEALVTASAEKYPRARGSEAGSWYFRLEGRGS